MSRGWLALLRIARRDARRARGRTALIVAMVALPVLAMTAIDVIARSAQLDPAEQVLRAMGRADVAVSSYSSAPLYQEPTSTNSRDVDTSGGGGSNPTPADPRPVLPPGSRVLEDSETTVTARTAGGIARVRFRSVDYADPMLTGLVETVDGRAPRTDDEVALSPELLTRMGLRLGDRAELVDPKRSFTVVGVAHPWGQVGGELMLARPGALPTRAAETRSTFYADTPSPVTWAQVQQMNRHGVLALSRAVLLDPPPRADVPFYTAPGAYDSGASEALYVVLVIALVGGLAGLEVVLLAGAAFAVGARRQARTLALLAAGGGEAGHLRRAVLAGGLVVGAVAGAVGVVLGVALAAGAMPLLERLGRAEFGHLDLRPLELLAIAAFGAVIAVLAAVLPARTAARLDVVAALSGRRGAVRTPRKVPVIGFIVGAIGVAAAVVGSGLALTLTSDETGSDATGMNVVVGLIVGGAALTQVGLIVTTPALVGALGRLGHRLPLAPRLALRDAARHRGRSAPAVAAVLAAVSGASALTLYVVSQDDRDRRGYTYSLPPGQAAVRLQSSSSDGNVATADPDRVRRAVVALPVRTATVVDGLDSSCGYKETTCRVPEVVVPPSQQCPLNTAEPSSPQEQRALEDRYAGDWRCASTRGPARIYGGYLPEFAVGDAALLRALAGTASREAERALATGGIVVFDRAQVHDGRATLAVRDLPPQGGEGTITARAAVPAAYLQVDRPPAYAVLSPAAARRIRLTPTAAALFLGLERLPTEQEEDRARAALSDAGVDPYSFYVERGYVDHYGPGLLALILGSAVITLGAAGIATGLAQADARPDHATLAAVGASPRLRRSLAMWQATAVAGLGTVLGIAAGFVPALAVIRASSSLELIVPWRNLAGILVGIPLLAALCAGLFVRSRLPLERRIA